MYIENIKKLITMSKKIYKNGLEAFTAEISQYDDDWVAKKLYGLYKKITTETDNKITSLLTKINTAQTNIRELSISIQNLTNMVKTFESVNMKLAESIEQVKSHPVEDIDDEKYSFLVKRYNETQMTMKEVSDELKEKINAMKEELEENKKSFETIWKMNCRQETAPIITANGKQEWRCNICGDTFDSQMKYYGHQKRHSPLYNPDTKKITPIDRFMTIIDKEPEPNKTIEIKPVKNDIEHKFECQICKKTFSSFRGLRSHERFSACSQKTPQDVTNSA